MDRIARAGAAFDLSRVGRTRGQPGDARGLFRADRAQQRLCRGQCGGAADAISFGRPFIANPDLVERIRAGVPLEAPDPATFYSRGAEGYTDYRAATEQDAR